jgi:WD40 repeat protein
MAIVGMRAPLSKRFDERQPRRTANDERPAPVALSAALVPRPQRHGGETSREREPGGGRASDAAHRRSAESEEDGGRPGWDITRLAAAAHYDSPTYRASREIKAVTHLSWSPDNRHLAYCLNRLGGSGTGELHVMTLQQKAAPWLSVEQDTKLLDEFTPAPSDCAFQPKQACFSPDGKWIAFSSCDAIFAISIDGRQLVKLISNASQPVW